MPIFIRSALAMVAVVAALATPLHAQMLEAGDAPRVLSTTRLTQRELNCRKALTLYDLAALCEGMELYDEALDAFAGVVKSFESAQAPIELDSMAQSDIAQQAASTLERMIKLCIKAKQYDRGLSLFAGAEKKYPVLSRRLNYHLSKVHTEQG